MTQHTNDTNHANPRDRFADIFGEDGDPAALRLAATLDHAYADTLPSGLDAAIRSTLRERAVLAMPRPAPTHRARTLSLPRARRPLLLAAVALVGLVAAGGAYAGGSLVDGVLSLFVNDAQQSAWHGQGASLNLAQTACGLTMTLTHAYADANRIIVGYTLNGRGPQRLNPDPRLYDASGTPLAPLDGGGSGSESGVQGAVLSFDASGITGQPRGLDLRLAAPWVKVIDASGAVEPGPIACARTFDFRFSVPFVPGQSIDLHQTVSSEGIAVTLDRVVVTPIETRVYLQRDAKLVNIPYVVDLVVNGHTLESGFNGQSYPDGRDIESFRPVSGEHGEATLTLSWPQGVVGALPKAQAASGPWTFHFTVP